MNKNLLRIVCLVLAVVAALCLIGFAVLRLNRKNSTDTSADSVSSSVSSGSEETSETVSIYGHTEDFDYQNFTYDDNLDENGYWSGIRALDYVTLPEDVTSITVDAATVTPTDSEIDTLLETLRNRFATSENVTDRAAQSGDDVDIDFSGSIDGVAFSNGSAEGYVLTLGSGQFIDGFEDQIIGHNIGETFDVVVTFPEGYGDATDPDGNTMTLGGQEAVFSVTLNAISQTVLPELTDAWVEENCSSAYGVQTLDELRTYYATQLYLTSLDNELLDYLFSNSTFADLPTDVTGYYVRNFLNIQYQASESQGITMDEYAQASGYADMDAALASMDDQFTSLAKQSLLYQAIAEQLDIAPTQDELNSASETYAAYYGENCSAQIALQLSVIDYLEDAANVS